jgi:hypothetical protein
MRRQVGAFALPLGRRSRLPQQRAKALAVGAG